MDWWCFPCKSLKSWNHCNSTESLAYLILLFINSLGEHHFQGTCDNRGGGGAEVFFNSFSDVCPNHNKAYQWHQSNTSNLSLEKYTRLKRQSSKWNVILQLWTCGEVPRTQLYAGSKIWAGTIMLTDTTSQQWFAWMPLHISQPRGSAVYGQGYLSS